MVNILDYIDKMQEMYGDKDPSSTVPEPRNMYAKGQLVQPSDDGSRPGYKGANQFSEMTEKVNKFLKGKKEIKQSVLTKKLKEIGYQNPQEFASVIANRKNIKLNRDVTLKKSPNINATMKELEGLVFDFNNKVLKDFNKGDMSKTISFSEYLRNKKLKHGSEAYYRTQAPNFNMINTDTKRLELAKKLVKEANDNSLRYVSFSKDIQPKLTGSTTIDTRKYKVISDTLDKPADKVNKAFNYLYENDIPLSTKTKSSSSLFRNALIDLTGVKRTENIAEGLNNNKNFVNNKNLITYANGAKLFQDGAGKTLKQIIDDAAYRSDGNIAWSGLDNKGAARPNRNVFDFALRHFNYHGKNKTGNSQIKFYYKGDTNMQNPIKWDDIPFDNNGVKKLKASDIFFTTNETPNKQWNLKNVDEDFFSWKKGNNPNTPFNEVFKAKDVYDNLLSEPMDDPVTGEKSNFGKIMKKVYEDGYNNFSKSTYAIEHGDTVANNPFKNLRIASQRVNSALYGLSVNKKLDAKTRNKISKILEKDIYNTDVKIIPNIIKSQKNIISDVLVKGKKFNSSLLSQLINDIGPCGAGKKKAMGGRIGLQKGRDVCMTGGRQTIAEFLKNGFKNANGEQKEIFKRILSLGGGAIKEVGKTLNPMELFKIKNLVGPGAWAAMGAFEAGAITYDVVNNNRPLNEVLSDNWITKYAMPYNLKEAQIKNLEDSGASLSPAAKEYMAQTKLMANFEREYKALEGMKMGVFGTKAPKKLIQDQEKKLENIVKDYQVFAESKIAGEAGELDFKKAFGEMEEKRGAGYYDPENDDANEYGYVDVGDSIFGFKKGTPLTYRYKKDRGKDQGRNLSETERKAEKLFPFETGTLRADYTPFNYKSFNYTPQKLPADMVKQYEKDYNLPPRTSLNQFYFEGSDNNVLQDLTNEYNLSQKAKQAAMYPGYYGSQFAGGGIAGLSGGDKSGPPPESGPASQGLRSLYKNGRKL
jgi:hypothetical protein